MKDLINILISGSISGSLYACMALGLSIVYGVTHIFNFGHGIVAVSGGYFTWLTMNKAGFSMIPAIGISMVIMFVIGLALYRLALSRLLKKENWEFSVIIFLLGLGILWENILLQSFGPRVKDIPDFIDGRFKMGLVRINYHDISLIVIVILFVIVLNYFIKKTWFGQAMRAVAQDMDGARIVGINLKKTFGFAFALATAVTGFSGILLATKFYMTPSVGWAWMVKGFVIVVFGGLGSITGAIYAAFILGMAEATITFFLGPMWVWPIWFFMFVIILLIRPNGLMGGRTL